MIERICTRISSTLSLLVATAAALLTLPLPAASQEVTPAWFGGVTYERDTFSGDSPIWTDWSAVRVYAVRSFGRLSAGMELSQVDRFDFTDRAVAGEFYLTLAEGTYAHLRGRVTPDAELLPSADLRGEVFHSLGSGWEGSAHLWMMDVAGPNVTVGGIGLAKYLNQWFVRSQGNLARIEGENAISGSLSARRFLGESSREYFEFAGGAGSEVVVLGAGPILDARRTWFVSGSHQRFLHDHFGISVGAGISDFEGVPSRRTLTLGLITRF